ncbi:hypothetical protein [Nitrosomonas communis]|uniref:Uncharacterized protein n=1 Tax=Nitrosomonas communis TaxID=44574 RepID=A0A1I4PSB9_9PROT|nr:hypothetical protein [Nitrosomonas communis]SFM30658.1 hypothetical protein SAMN05421863_102254 [Nitrosomonas communis]
MDDLMKSINSLEIEKITGESQETIKRWKKGTKKIPESAIRLLKLYVNGDATALLGKDWEGHVFKDGMLFVPEWRRGFTPGEIRAYSGNVSLLQALKVKYGY